MEAIDTVMSEGDVLKLCEENPLLDFSCTDDYPQEFEAIVNKQAEITAPIFFKAGRESILDELQYGKITFQGFVASIKQESIDKGRKEVVEWSNEWCPHRDNDFPCPDYVPNELRLHKRDCPDCWQAQLKEWGL